MDTRNFNRTLIAAALIAVATAAQAGPRHGHDSLVRAKVVSSVPVYQTINEPRTECWTETVGYGAPREYRDSNGGAVLGAIAGGLIGSTVGKGNGRVAAAAVGAATGAVVGDRLSDRQYANAPRQIERCQTQDNVRRVISGYDVRYRYEGREYAAHLPYDPGRFVSLRVSVEIADDQPDFDRDRGYNDRDDR